MPREGQRACERPAPGSRCDEAEAACQRKHRRSHSPACPSAVECSLTNVPPFSSPLATPRHPPRSPPPTAIDAPSPSLPLVNSLTHLAYLTATSPRIREILSLDGGLERLVRILNSCTSGPKTLLDENLSTMKGTGTTLVPGARKSPFRPFAEYGIPLSVSNGSATTTPATQPQSTKSKHLLYTYTLAFQCVVNIGVRGSEQIRTRVVEAGALDVVVFVLEKYLDDVERKRGVAELEWREGERSGRREKGKGAAVVGAGGVSTTAAGTVTTRVRTAPVTVVAMDADDTASSSSGQEETDELASGVEEVETMRCSSVAGGKGDDDGEVEAVDRDGDITMEEDEHLAQQTPRAGSSTANISIDAAQGQTDGLVFREEDVLLSLQLLAYLSKYPHVRSVFHTPSDNLPFPPSSSTSSIPAAPAHAPAPLPLSSNVFSLVEAFTHRPASTDRFTPRHSSEIQYWAGVIMRNACRKDDARGGIRQCANMQCGTWEAYPREFAKCRRCRKAKYCSKGCQSKAWGGGHRYWCAKAAPKDTEREREDAAALGGEGRRSRDHHPRASRHEHHHHTHTPSDVRPSTANSFDEEEAEHSRVEAAIALRNANSRLSNPTLPRGLQVDGGGGQMDENEHAVSMLGGGVFGDLEA